MYHLHYPVNCGEVEPPSCNVGGKESRCRGVTEVVEHSETSHLLHAPVEDLEGGARTQPAEGLKDKLHLGENEMKWQDRIDMDEPQQPSICKLVEPSERC